MDSESQNNGNSVENATTSDTTMNDEHNQQSAEVSQNSTDQSNIVDLIGNGQIVKKASKLLFLNHLLMCCDPTVQIQF